VKRNKLLGNAVRTIRNRFIASSDLANAYMIRGGKNIPFDLNQFLHMADYYINLAGGRDDLLNNGKGIRITDMNNRKLSTRDMIAPETMIDVPTNRFSARFNQYGPIITTILSIITTTLSILAVTGAF
jgi:hypothetical protein